jgi:SAM-dependent methyltransferase
LFDLYFNGDGELSFPFGVAGTSKITRTDWNGLAATALAGQPVKVPANAEMMAEHIYGKSWRTPIAGFNWKRARTTRARAGWTPAEYSEEVYWSNFYAHQVLTSGSTFFDFVVSRDDIPRTVLDIGCGDGRDTFAFAKAGMHAIGLDRSSVGVRNAMEKAQQAGLTGSLSFVAGDVADLQSLQTIFSQVRAIASDGPVLFYMRFFLHSIPEETQRNLLTALSNAAQPRDMLAVEFRTDKDEQNHKVYGKHYRRYQNGAAFGEALRTQYGFATLHEEEKTGLSPYKDEDPVLYRAIAIKGPK